MRLGKASTIVICLVSALLVAGIIFSRGSGMEAAGIKFMDALARHDVETLTAISYLGETDPGKIEARKADYRKKWDFSVNQAGVYFMFTWRVTGSVQTREDAGSVQLQVRRNAANPLSYEEKFELPMVKEGEAWKVDVPALSAELFPAIPR